MGLDRYTKQTNLQDVGRARTNSAAADAQNWDQMSESMKGISSYFNTKAAEIAQKAGKTAGENSVVLNADGTITRDPIPDAGKYYTEEFMQAQQISEITASKAAMDDFTAKFLLKNLEDPNTNDSAAFANQFKAFSEQLIEDASPEAKGMLTMSATMLGAAGMNGIAVEEMRVQLDTQKAALDNDVKLNIARLGQLSKIGHGNNKEALVLSNLLSEQLEKGKFLFTGAEIESHKSSVAVAIKSGELFKSMEGKSDEKKLNMLSKFNGNGGYTATEIAQIKSIVGKDFAATMRVNAERDRATLKDNVDKANDMRVKIADLMSINGYTQEIHEQMWKDVDKTDKTFAALYISTLQVTTKVADDANKAIRKRDLDSNIRTLRENNGDDLEILKKWADATPEEEKALGDAVNAKHRRLAVILKATTKDAQEAMISAKVGSGLWTPELFKEWKSQPDTVMGKLAREHDTYFKTALNEYDKELGFSRKKASIPGTKDNWLASKHASLNSASEPLDITNEPHFKAAEAYVIKNGVVPDEIQNQFDFVIHSSPEHVSAAVGLYDSLRQGRNHLKVNVSDKKIRQLKTNLEASVDEKTGKLNPAKFAEMQSRDANRSINQIEREKEAVRLIDSKEVIDGLSLQANAVIDSSSVIGDAVDNIIGNGGGLRGLGFNPGSDPDNSSVPNNLKGWLYTNRPDKIPSNVAGVLEEIFENVYTTHPNYIDDKEGSIKRAFQIASKMGLSVTQYASPKDEDESTYQWTMNGFEKATQKFRAEPSRVLSAYLKQNFDSIKKKISQQGLGHLTFTSEKVSKRTFPFKLGFKEQISSLEFVENMLAQKRILIDDSGIPGVFRVKFILQSNGGDKPVLVGEIQPDSDELSHIMKEDSKTLSGRLRNQFDPTKMTFRDNSANEDSVSEFQLGQSPEMIGR
tara:strand:- start:2253 stop:5009 length:2757 start_codon:yes stop_codon:yes gene_type:complete